MPFRARLGADESVPEFGVEASCGPQLVVATPFDDASVVEDDDLVGVHDRGEPVGDHDRRAAGEGLGQGLLDERLGFGVEVAGGLGEDDDVGGLEQQSGDDEPLLLAAGEAVAALSDDGVVALGELADHVEDAGGPPGGIEVERDPGTERPADLAGAVESDVPIQRFGTQEEVAALVVYIASKHASYITGHCFHINGGDHFA